MTELLIGRISPGRQLGSIAAMSAKVVAMGIACFFAIVPLVWGLVTSLKPDSEVITPSPKWVPDTVTVSHYRALLESHFPMYILNSAIVAVLTIIFSLLLASHAAFAFSRFTFRFKRLILFSILASMMVARLANIVPLYLIAAKTGLLNTRVVLVLVYSGWQMPIAVWLLVDFFRNVPTTLDNAARLDGYATPGIFYKVVLPLVRPGLAAVAIVVFMFVWNDFVIAGTLISSDSKRMATVGLYNLVGQFGVPWGDLMAGVMITLVPVVVLFSFIQRSFMAGMTSGAIKG